MWGKLVLFETVIGCLGKPSSDAAANLSTYEQN